jgi:hypothetical protein
MILFLSYLETNTTGCSFTPLGTFTQKLSSYPGPLKFLIAGPTSLPILKSKAVPPTFVKFPVGIDSESVSVILSALIAMTCL